MELSNLFSPGKIGNVQIKNRIIRSATYERRATKDGYVSEELINYHKNLANGGVGLIITGMLAVDKTATSSVCQSLIFDDSFIEGQKKLVNIIHDCSNTKIAAQISHPGRQGAHPKYPNVAPSPIRDVITKKIPKELTTEEIGVIIKKYIEAGKRVYESGFDMVQIHAAHGYLLSNFISPYTNQRNDEFGGNTQNRAKILVDIYNGIRDEVGKEFPIIIKLNMFDGVPNGLELDPEGKIIAKMVVDAGYDAIEPSAGIAETLLGSSFNIPSARIKSPEDENYLLPMTKEIKSIAGNVPIILLGGVRNPVSADKFIGENQVDFISMSRPLIREPNLPNKWKSGDRSPPLCISCNQCYMSIMTGPTFCAVAEKLRKKEERKRKRELKKKL
ncbi:MAG: NADH:flavin oxidoreductase [archaeon]|nr:NADH:flavin oxidoreductase [archaeon]